MTAATTMDISDRYFSFHWILELITRCTKYNALENYYGSILPVLATLLYAYETIRLNLVSCVLDLFAKLQISIF